MSKKIVGISIAAVSVTAVLTASILVVTGKIGGRFCDRAGRDDSIYSFNGDARFKDRKGDSAANGEPLNTHMEYAIAVPSVNSIPAGSCVTQWSWPVVRSYDYSDDCEQQGCITIGDYVHLRKYDEINYFDADAKNYGMNCGYAPAVRDEGMINYVVYTYCGTKAYYLVAPEGSSLTKTYGQSEGMQLACFDFSVESDLKSDYYEYVPLDDLYYCRDIQGSYYKTEYNMCEDNGIIYIYVVPNEQKPAYVQLFTYDTTSGETGSYEIDVNSCPYNLVVRAGCMVEDGLVYLTYYKQRDGEFTPEMGNGEKGSSFYDISCGMFADAGIVAYNPADGTYTECPEFGTRYTNVNIKCPDYMDTAENVQSSETPYYGYVLMKNDYGMFWQNDEGVVYRPKGSKETEIIYDAGYVKYGACRWNIDGEYVYYLVERGVCQSNAGYEIHYDGIQRKNYITGEVQDIDFEPVLSDILCDYYYIYDSEISSDDNEEAIIGECTDLVSMDFVYGISGNNFAVCDITSQSGWNSVSAAGSGMTIDGVVVSVDEAGVLHWKYYNYEDEVTTESD